MKVYIDSNIDRIVLISDIHFGVRNASIEWIENMTRYFDNFFIPLLQKYKSAGENVAVIVAGDYFDNRQHVDINVLNTGMQVMQKIAAEVSVYVSIGNHDIYKKKETNVNSLCMFKYLSNVNLIEEVSTLEIKNGIKFLMIPWVGDGPEETKIINKHKDEVDFIILHSDISGLNYDNGRQIINGVNTTGIENKIYSGHIHKRQHNKNVTYLGSPYQLRRSDIGNDKGIYSLKVSDTEIEEAFEQNNYSPEFIKLRLENLLELSIEEITKKVANNYVDVIVEKKYKDDINVAKLIDIFIECKVKKIELIVNKTSSEYTDETVIAAADKSVSEVFKDRLSQFDLTEEEKQILIKLNEAYLIQAADALGGNYEEDIKQ